jgi:hypothetical protein
MFDENKDYAWKFTGCPYLDGIIFGAGVPRNKNCVLINISLCPGIIADDIEKKFNEIGYDAGYQEIPNGLTKEIDLRLYATGPYPIYKTKTLPRFSERRLIIDETPMEFIYGFFTVCSDVKMAKYYNKHYGEDSIVIKTALPMEDTLQLLLRVGIEEYETIFKNVKLEREVFEGKKPFERIYQEFLKEDVIYGKNMTKNEIIENRMAELQKNMWDVPEDVFDDRTYEYQKK